MSGLWRHAYPFLIIASSCTKNLISTHGLRLLERVFKCTRYWWEQIIIQHIWSYNRGKRTMQQLPLNVKVCFVFFILLSACRIATKLIVNIANTATGFISIKGSQITNPRLSPEQTDTPMYGERFANIPCIYTTSKTGWHSFACNAISWVL